MKTDYSGPTENAKPNIARPSKLLLLLLLLLLLFSPLAQSHRHDNTEVREMCNGYNSVSFGNHSVPEGDRSPPLKSHRKALQQESGFPGVFCDCGVVW